MNKSIFILAMLTSLSSFADYGVPFIFQQCNKTLDFATYKFEYVNNPEGIFEDGKLNPSVKTELVSSGVILPEHINTATCELDKASIKIWIEDTNLVSLSINDVKKVSRIPIDGEKIIFDKITIDGSSYPRGAKNGSLSICYFGKGKKPLSAKEYFHVYFDYQDNQIIDTGFLGKEVEIKNKQDNPIYASDCSGFDRYFSTGY